MNRFLAEGEDLETFRSRGKRLRDLICGNKRGMSQCKS